MLIHSVLGNPALQWHSKQIASQALLNWSQVRFRKAVYFRKYQQPHLKQKILLAACEPIFERDQRLPAERCGHLTPRARKPYHPYDVLLAADMKQELEDSVAVCFIHRNQMTKPERRLAANEFYHADMALRYYNRDVAEIATKGTRYSSILHFASGTDFTVLFAPDLTKLGVVFKILKRYRQLILLGAMVEKRRLVTVSQLETISKMPDLDQQRALLCATLNLPPQSLLSTLNHHSSHLSQLLQSHAKGTEESKSNQQQESQ